MASIDLSGIVSSVASAMPSQDAIFQNMAVSAAAGVMMAGLKAQLGNGALPDPLHLATNSTGGTNVAVGPTIAAATFATLPAATQTLLLDKGYHIV